MYLQRKSYMVNNTRVIFSFPVKDLHMSYFQVIGLQDIYIPILLLSMQKFPTCKRLKTYDTYWDSILLFFIVLKVSSITCPGKLSETQNLFLFNTIFPIQTFSIYYQLRYKKSEIQWNIRVNAHESFCIENKKLKFTWKSYNTMYIMKVDDVLRVKYWIRNINISLWSYYILTGYKILCYTGKILFLIWIEKSIIWCFLFVFCSIIYSRRYISLQPLSVLRPVR